MIVSCITLSNRRGPQSRSDSPSVRRINRGRWNSRVENETFQQISRCGSMSLGTYRWHREVTVTVFTYRKNRQTGHWRAVVTVRVSCRRLYPGQWSALPSCSHLAIWPLPVLHHEAELWCEFSSSVFLMQSGISNTCVADLIFFMLPGPHPRPWTLCSLPETLVLVT